MTFVIKNLEVSLGNIKEKNFNLERRYNWPEVKSRIKLELNRDIYLMKSKYKH